MCRACSRTHWAGLTCSLPPTHMHSLGLLGLSGPAPLGWPRTMLQTAVAFCAEEMVARTAEGKLWGAERLVGLGWIWVG
ncbi:hypothetical protein ACFX15_045164 [Malus domestica]